MTVRVGSLFSGVGGMDHGLECAGMDVAWFVEKDAQCRDVLAHHWPDTPILEDVCDVGRHNLTPVDLIAGGSPCFPKGTLIFCRDGQKDIAEVEVGDEVLTHHGRWMPVVRVGSKEASTVLLKGQGHSGLTTTSEHPFLASTARRVSFSRKKPVSGPWTGRSFSDPDWIPAKDMQGKFWASPTVFPSMEIPSIENCGMAKAPDISFDSSFFWFLGAWLGDGWVRDGQRPNRSVGQCWGQIFICSNKKQREELQERLDKTGLTFSALEARTTTKFRCDSIALARWITKQFGRGAGGKSIPAWVYGLPEELRRSLFDGYMYADGCYRASLDAWQSTSINKKLTVGMKSLAQSLGYTCSMEFHAPNRVACIEGRVVHEQPTYMLRCGLSQRHSVMIGKDRYGLVRSVVPTNRKEIVYNIEVEGDHSYVADGIIVHNCQGFSVAGLRNSLDDDRSNLMFEFVRICDELDPEWILWENVPGVLSLRDNAFGCLLAALVGADAPLVSTDKRGRWTNAGLVIGPRRTVAWRVMDAQYDRVPQRRRRVFVVANSRNRSPGEVLFERNSEVGDHPPRREARQGDSAVTQIGVDLRNANLQGDVAGTLQAKVQGYSENALPHVIVGSPDLAVNLYHCAIDGEVSQTLRSNESGGGYTAAMPHVISIRTAQTSSNGWGINEEGTAYTLDSGNGQAVAFAQNTRNEVRIVNGDGLITGAIAAQQGMKQTNYIAQEWRVRRLMPIEHERLMKWPDGWTAVGASGKQMADTVRYRMTGNGVAAPCAEWIGRRIVAASARMDGGVCCVEEDVAD